MGEWYLPSEWASSAFWSYTPQALYMMMWPMFSHVECRQDKCCDKEEEEEKEESPIMEQPLEGEELKSPTE